MVPPEKDMVDGGGALPAVSGRVVRGCVQWGGWPTTLEPPLGATRWGKWPAGVGDGHVEVTSAGVCACRCAWAGLGGRASRVGGKCGLVLQARWGG